MFFCEGWLRNGSLSLWRAAFKIGIGSLWVLDIVEVREAVVCISMEDVDKCSLHYFPTNHECSHFTGKKRWNSKSCCLHGGKCAKKTSIVALEDRIFWNLRCQATDTADGRNPAITTWDV